MVEARGKARLGRLPLFRSDAQARLLSHLFLARPDRPQSLSSLSKRLEIPLSTVQREIDVLERAGIVRSERVGNTRLVAPNTESPYHWDLSSLLLKAFGPTTLLAAALRSVPRIAQAYVYGSWARLYLGDESVAPHDLDVVVVGDPEPAAVYRAARRIENDLSMEVNPIIVSEAEWNDPAGLVRRIKEEPLVPVPVM